MAELYGETSAGGQKPLLVGADGSVSVGALAPGTGATALGKAEDAAHTTGDTGVMLLAVRKDTAAALAGSDGDYIPVIVDANGRLHVALPGSFTAYAEDVAHTSGDAGVMLLAVRQDTMAALAGTTGDYIPPTTDANGQMRVLVGAPDIVVTVTPTVGAGADFTFDASDLVFDATEIANAVRVNGGTCILQTITLLDKADQGVAMTLVFANAATDFGTIDSAPDPDDTESGTVLGTVAITTSDYVDLGANKVATIRNIGLLMQAGAASTSLYVAGINGTGTPTYEASGLVFQFGFLRS